MTYVSIHRQENNIMVTCIVSTKVTTNHTSTCTYIHVCMQAKFCVREITHKSLTMCLAKSRHVTPHMLHMCVVELVTDL